MSAERYPTGLGKGLWTEIAPLTFGRARIIVTDGFGVLRLCAQRV